MEDVPETVLSIEAVRKWMKVVEKEQAEDYTVTICPFKEKRAQTWSKLVILHQEWKRNKKH